MSVNGKLKCECKKVMRINEDKSKWVVNERVIML
jgi:hypothetical protein